MEWQDFILVFDDIDTLGITCKIFYLQVRLCKQCNNIRHNTRRGADHIIYSPSIQTPWDMEPETQNYLVKAVVSLLQEAKPYGAGTLPYK